MLNDLQKSEVVIAKILAHLAETGLKPTELTNETLNLDAELEPFFLTCYEWLEAENIVRSKEILRFLDGEVSILGPTITAYGFSLLAQGVILGGHQQTVGKAVGEVASGRSYSQIGDFFGGLLGGLTKALGS